MSQQEKSGLDFVMELLRTPIPLPFVSAKTRRRARGNKRNAAVKKEGAYVQPFFLSGTIERGANAKFSIGGEDFVIDSDTWIFGEVRYGAVASVKGEKRGSQNYAKKIVMS